MLLSLENDEIDEKERGKGEVVVVRVLRRGSSLRRSKKKRAICVGENGVNVHEAVQ